MKISILLNKIKRVKIYILTLFLLGIFSCENKDKDIKTDPVVSTFYLIRHAEKDRTNLENSDPELNQDGLGRAVKWAEVFTPVDLDIIYSTNYERTSMTAAPTSIKKDINVTYYNPSEIDIEALKEKHLGKNVLIVGHSNTTPIMVNKLLGEDKYEQMDDDDNSSLFVVRIIDNAATDIRLHMN